MGRCDLDGWTDSGTLPSELGLLTGLIRLLMRDNDLTGTLPAMMSGSRIKDLYLDNNQLVVRLISSATSIRLGFHSSSSNRISPHSGCALEVRTISRALRLTGVFHPNRNADLLPQERPQERAQWFRRRLIRKMYMYGDNLSSHWVGSRVHGTTR